MTVILRQTAGVERTRTALVVTGGETCRLAPLVGSSCSAQYAQLSVTQLLLMWIVCLYLMNICGGVGERYLQVHTFSSGLFEDVDFHKGHS